MLASGLKVAALLAGITAAPLVLRADLSLREPPAALSDDETAALGWMVAEHLSQHSGFRWNSAAAVTACQNGTESIRISTLPTRH